MHKNAAFYGRSRLWLPLTAVILLILYGSLYPFRFSLPQKGLFIWDQPHTLGAARDLVINVMMYLPLGFLLGKALPGSPAGALAGLLTGLFLSAGLEYLQSFDAGRYSSILDLAMNTVGTGLGIGAASLVRLRGPVGFTRKVERNPAALSLILLMAASHLFPFFPRVHYAEWRQAVHGFLSGPISALPFLFNIVEWLGMWVLLITLLEQEMVILVFLMFVLTIPMSLVIAGQSPSWTELLAACLATLVGVWWRKRPKQLLVPWFWLTIAGRELMPFHWVAIPQPFHWTPFVAAMESGPNLAIVLLRKSFLYGSAIWLTRGPAQKATLLLAGLLLVLEQFQCYLPGRIPESTDALMALLVGAGLIWERARLQQDTQARLQ